MSITRRNFYPPLNEHGKGEIMDKIGEKVRKKTVERCFLHVDLYFCSCGCAFDTSSKIFFANNCSKNPVFFGHPVKFFQFFVIKIFIFSNAWGKRESASAS